MAPLFSLLTIFFTFFLSYAYALDPEHDLTQDNELTRLLSAAWPPTQVHDTRSHVIRHVETQNNITAAPTATEEDGASPQDRLDKRTTLRVMIVGDSMTQGQHGDFTWRYRISQWFSSNGIAVNFVGPYVGTVAAPVAAQPAPPRLQNAGPAPPDSGSFTGPYAAGANFDTDHYSAWGRPVAYDKQNINAVLNANMADMLLVMLGFNDLGWFYSDAAGTLDSMTTFVSEARKANPNIKIALANIPQRSFIGGRQDLVDGTTAYNGMLAQAIPKWTTAQSPISLVHLQENYDCEPSACPAGYDGLHPNELGEYQIAHAFSLSLYNDFKMGGGPLAIPGYIPPRPMTQQVPGNFRVFSSPQGVTATWDAVFGAYSYDVQSTITFPDGSTCPMNWSPGSVSANRWDSHWPLDGWTYTVQVRARAGDTRVGPWSASLSAVAHPQLASPPSNIKVTPTSTGVDLTWGAPSGGFTSSIVEYNVIYFDIDSCNFLTGAAFQGNSGHIDGLIPGHHIFLAIVAWNANGEGFPAVLPTVRAGGGTPAVPGKVNVNVFDPTSVQITWPEVAGAAGYAIWMRNVNDPKSVSQRMNGTVSVSCDNIYFLFPGAWNYEFCVSAYNGNLESARGGCAVGPKVSTTSPGPTCPAGPTWCSSGSSGFPKAPSSGPTSSNPSGGNPGSGTGKSPSSPSIVPTSDPNIQDSYTTLDWFHFTCSDPSVVDATQPPSYQWSAVDTESAWNSVNNAWKAYRNAGGAVTYVTYVSNFFHGPPAMACQVANVQNGCSAGILCGPSKPGGFHILNSFVQTAEIFTNLELSIQHAKSGVALSANKFGATFATFDDEQEKLLALFVDLLSFGFIATLTPVWAYALKLSAWAKTDAGKAGSDVIKDETNNFGTTLARAGKNFLPSGSQLAINANLEDFANQVMDGWANQTTAFQAYLFSGSDQAITDLHGIISDGKMLDFTTGLQTDDVVNHNIRRVLWLKMLPVAWAMGSTHQSPFLLNSGSACGTTPPYLQVDPSVAAKNSYCYNNDIYYLLAPPASTNPCINNGRGCLIAQLTALKGVDTLTPGNVDWEGITLDDLIIGGVRTYQANGSKNVPTDPDDTDPNELGLLQSNDPTTPGLVHIPVCSQAEVFKNWHAQKFSNLNYPCN